MSQTKFEPSPLSEVELNLLRTLRTHLHLNKIDTFTVDTLRQLQFERFLKKDARGYTNFGSLIYKWSFFGFTESTGKFVCSTYEGSHGTRVQVWKMKQP